MKWWTAAIVMFTGSFVLLWDVFAFAKGGLDATLSALVTGYLGIDGNPLPGLGVGFLVGGYTVHFLGWTMERPR